MIVKQLDQPSPSRPTGKKAEESTKKEGPSVLDQSLEIPTPPAPSPQLPIGPGSAKYDPSLRAFTASSSVDRFRRRTLDFRRPARSIAGHLADWSAGALIRRRLAL